MLLIFGYSRHMKGIPKRQSITLEQTSFFAQEDLMRAIYRRSRVVRSSRNYYLHIPSRASSRMCFSYCIFLTLGGHTFVDIKSTLRKGVDTIVNPIANDA